MASKIYLIFIVAFMVEISLARIWVTYFPAEVKKRNLSEEELQKFHKEANDLLEIITLNETMPLWKKSNFLKCFNDKSYDYNMAIINMRNNSIKFLDKYRDESTITARYLIDGIKTYINKTANAIDDLRSNIFYKVQSMNFEDMQNFREDQKLKITNNLKGFYENVLSIKKEKRINDYMKVDKVETRIEQELLTLEKATKNFVNDIKSCMNV